MMSLDLDRPNSVMAFRATITDSSESDEEVIILDDIYLVQPEDSFLAQPTLSARINVFPSKCDKLILVIAFFNTGAASSVMKPIILLQDFQSSKWEYFQHSFSLLYICTVEDPS